MAREIPFWELQERVKSSNFKANVVTGLWNLLALRLLSIKRPVEGPAKCMLPLEKLLQLSPEKAKNLEGMGPARFAVYKVLFESLKLSPAALRDRSREVRLENFLAFAVGNHANFVGLAWNRFIGEMYPSVGLSRNEAASLDKLESFCERMKDKGRRKDIIHESHYNLLCAWLRHLKS